MRERAKAILGIDRGSKYIGLAYVNENEKIPFPIGYVLNDKMAIFSIADFVIRYNVKKIVIGYPQKQKDVQQRIDSFISSVAPTLDPKMEFEKVDEDYTSVQAGEMISDFQKNFSTDTVSAMIILERWLQTKDLLKQVPIS